MPEINEIRNYALFINNILKNKEILDIKIINGRYKNKGPFEGYDVIKREIPIKVLDVKTKGKLLYMILDNNYYILSTLGLSGGWCYLKNGKKPEMKNYDFSKNIDYYDQHVSEDSMKSWLTNALNHLNIEFKTNQGSLFYHDTLSFGTLKVIKGVDELNKKLKTLGPDIMDIDTNLELFTSQIKKTKNLTKAIGIVLMDQKTISGIGNYLRSDILYLSKINPFRKVNKLEDSEIKTIFNNSKILTWGEFDLKEAKKLGLIKKTTKLPADYDRLFFVYSQDTDIHGNEVIKKELYEGSQKRFIYYVPEIQK
jgi:formamidopyrimidine-DNA glycosylase